jgi:hypothetical protein
MVERTIEFALYEDLRHLYAATALLGQGRQVEALSVLHRARSAFAETASNRQRRCSSSSARSLPEAKNDLCSGRYFISTGPLSRRHPQR